MAKHAMRKKAAMNPVSTAASAPKLKDYLEARKKAGTVTGYLKYDYPVRISSAIQRLI